MTVDTSETVKKIEQEIAKIHTKQLDISFNEIADMYLSGELNIKPEFQRLFRWSEEKRSRFIESLILEMPVPPIFVIEVQEGRFELIDGLQRISSYLHFRGVLKSPDSDDDQTVQPLKLSGCEIAPVLNGYTFDDLPATYQIRLKRNFIRMQIIRKENDPMLRYHMFKRLNTGGEQLQPQELRNCTVRLISDDFANFISEISENVSFQNTTENISDFNSQIAYREELALRFFANKNYMNKYVKNIEPFLDEYMKNVSLPESNDDHVDFDYQEEKNHFEKLFLVLDKALGGKAFGSKNTRSDGITDSFRIYHFESIPLAISHIIDKVNPDNDNHISLIRQALTEIKFDPDFVKLTTGGGKNTKNMLEERIAYVSNYLEGIDFG